VQRNYESLFANCAIRMRWGRGRREWRNCLADIFAQHSVAAKVLPKLIRSYATEAVVTRAKGGKPASKMRRSFSTTCRAATKPPTPTRHLSPDGNHRRRFKVFELTSLLPKTGFQLHVAKMASDKFQLSMANKEAGSVSVSRNRRSSKLKMKLVMKFTRLLIGAGSGILFIWQQHAL